MIDLRDFVAEVVRIVERHEVGDVAGAWARRLPPGVAPDGDRAIACGTADAVSILYTVRHLPPPAERQHVVERLRSLQEPATGLYRDPRHDALHTTAHVLGALELLGAKPAHGLGGLAHLRSPDEVPAFLEALDWEGDPWRASHEGAALYAALVLAGEATHEWETRYFDWLWEEADAASGLWRRGCVDRAGDGRLFHHLAGSAHYLANLEHARRPLRYPGRMVDSCLRLERDGLFPELFRGIGSSELHWAYCLSRSLHQSGHRHAEARHALAGAAERYAAHVLSLDPSHDPGLNDLHELRGTVSAFAELQRAIPGLLRTDHPLRLVLDRRPFL